MKVGIDTLGCDHGKSGLGTYLLSLVNALSPDPDIEFELFGCETDRYTFTRSKAFSFTPVNVKDRGNTLKWWHVLSANRFFRRRKYDLVIYAAAARMMAPKASVRTVAVVNDIASSRLSGRGFFSSMTKRGLLRADVVVAPSMYVKKNLVNLGVSQERIRIIHNGINHSQFFPFEIDSASSIADIKPFAIKKPYFIYASRMQSEKKRHVELIRAFSDFKRRTGLPHRLVLAGEEGPGSDAILDEAFRSEFAGDIFITGYFPMESMPALLRNSECLVFPAENEGAGLPVLEAMAVGVPVICSKSGALGEIAGDRALYFDGTVEGLSDAMERIVADRKLAGALVDGGIEWANRFSWDKTAEEMLSLIREFR